MISAIDFIIDCVTKKLYHKNVRIFIAAYSLTAACFCVFIFIHNFDYKNLINILTNHDLINSNNSEVLVNKISFLDAGQGDAIFIQTLEGHRMLIDAGNVDGKAVTEIHKLIPWYDRRLDIALGTHADQDHVGGFAKIFKNFSVGYFLSSNIHTTKTVEKNLLQQIADAEISTSSISRGARIEFGSSGVLVDILYPTKMMKIKSDKDTNLFSIVAIVNIKNKNLSTDHSTTKFLLTGDVPQSVEKLLIKNGDDLNVDILKVGHHGSRTSTSPDFLHATSPSIAVISAGKNNRYGHPHEEVINMLADMKVSILETSKSGTISFP